MNIDVTWFEDWDGYTGPPITDDMVRKAEAKLGFKLPKSYIELLRVKNGGILKYNRFPTLIPTGWAEDHVQINAIFGIGGEHGIDTELGSQYMIPEWGYPDVGVWIGMTPSGGHEAIMLDYTECGPQGEPRVIYADVETEDGEPYVVILARDFETFIQGCHIGEDLQASERPIKENLDETDYQSFGI